MRHALAALLLLLCLPLAACNAKASAGPTPVERLRADAAAVAARPEAADPAIEVQHLLISFRGIPRGPAATRTREEAEALAADLYAEVQGGADFAALQQEHSDDPGAGIYGMTQDPKVPAEWQRKGMVPAFGDVGWRLAVGEIGIAPYDPKTSPYGWHLIKRLK